MRLRNHAQILGINLNGHYFRDTPGVLDGYDSVFCPESPHKQWQLTVGCHVDGGRIDPPHVRQGFTAMAHPYNKFDFFLTLLFALSEKQTGGEISRLPS
jgi:hypothetical protein